jgi:four helix bundle protein
MAKRIRSFQDLVVWQRSMELIDEVERIVDLLTPQQRAWLGTQMLRAALSIASNIAEGHDAEYTMLYLRRLSDARGSTREVHTQLLVSRRRKNVPPTETETALRYADEIGRMLRALSKQVRARRLKRGGNNP